MADDFETLKEDLASHVFTPSDQIWLFGAGISFDAKIPLMVPLTKRVKKIIENNSEIHKDILNALETELTEDCHIEHYLSHLGDLIAMAKRSRDTAASLGENQYTREQLETVYKDIISSIGDTIRYGYDSNNDIAGTPDKPIINIKYHVDFIESLFQSRSNLDQTKTTLFTTNYDTLLEDALSLHKKIVVDGFSGGAVGFWNPNKEFVKSEASNLCLLYKLHGSVDWHHYEDKGLVRFRYGSNYLPDPTDIMIYPQATKYVETQKDPFALLFSKLRDTLNMKSQNVLITCGYSFGDEHINSEIETCLNHPDNNTTVVAFVKEQPCNNEPNVKITPTLDKWLMHQRFGNRIFVAGEKGIYYNSVFPTMKDDPSDCDWWTFKGLTRFLKDSGSL